MESIGNGSNLFERAEIALAARNHEFTVPFSIFLYQIRIQASLPVIYPPIDPQSVNNENFGSATVDNAARTLHFLCRGHMVCLAEHARMLILKGFVDPRVGADLVHSCKSGGLPV